MNDITLFGLSLPLVENTIQSMKEYFEIKDLEIATWLLGIHIQQEKDCIVLSLESYIEKALKRFKMQMSYSIPSSLNKGEKLIKRTIKKQLDNPINYQQIIESFIYAVPWTVSDLAHTITVLSQQSPYSNETHLNAAKHSLWYLNKTKDWTLRFLKGKTLNLKVFTDSDYLSCTNTKCCLAVISLNSVDALYSGALDSRMSFPHEQPKLSRSHSGQHANNVSNYKTSFQISRSQFLGLIKLTTLLQYPLSTTIRLAMEKNILTSFPTSCVKNKFKLQLFASNDTLVNICTKTIAKQQSKLLANKVKNTR